MSPASRSRVPSRRSRGCGPTVTGCASSPTTRHAPGDARGGVPRDGLELEDDDLQTTPIAAPSSSAGRRVYALVMSAIVPDLAGIELVGDSADAVLLGGCDETVEPNQVFSYMNLARAFAEIQAGADLFCLHKNPGGRPRAARCSTVAPSWPRSSTRRASTRR